MYNAFFGFKEKPFKLVPNPDYLFMSKSHEIAMAHLVYAMDQGDGFVVITGEVGTGKTTLCRNFLALLNDTTESAYIFNPTLAETELLASICTEFGIACAGGSVKELLDALNQYLINLNEGGRKAILLIDEAQNLTVKNLEMVRMLSNLETTRNKLLQIILVGQPELNDKLDSHELRQLAQRISLSYYLNPLSARETEGYIHHRIHIAAQRQVAVFSTRACRVVHRYANGIPRLINIACDRALLTAYSLNLGKVTGAVVRTAIKELTNRGLSGSPGGRIRRLIWSAAVVCLLGVSALALVQGGLWDKGTTPLKAVASREATTPAGQARALTFPSAAQTFRMPSPPQGTENAAPLSAPAEPVKEPPPSNIPGTEEKIGAAMIPSLQVDLPYAAQKIETSAIAVDSIMARIAELNMDNSRQHATEALLALWQQPQPNVGHIVSVVDDSAFFEIAARQYGLRLHTVEDNWPLVQQLNLPAIVSVRESLSGRTAYVTLVAWRGERIYLQDLLSRKAFETDLNSLRPHLQGSVYIFWKNILGFDAIISQGADNHAVLALKELLRQVGYRQLAPSPVFDKATTAAVIDFQVRNQLDADGLVGPLTKIVLINAVKAFETPRLDLERGTGA
jgi:general secretion pathway protein A